MLEAKVFSSSIAGGCLYIKQKHLWPDHKCFLLSKEKLRPKGRNLFQTNINYSASIAPVGQAASQAPQSRHASASITYLPSPSEIAPTGHSPAHAPHIMQASVILYAMIIPPFDF
jgi:hypothetical protein